jgi:type I restriction enzyme R subunit
VALRQARGRADHGAAAAGEEMKRLFDLSALDPQRLAELFAGGQRKTAREILGGQTEERARALARRNPSRTEPLEPLN